MNRFKPGDKARVIGNRDNYHGFKISEEVEILQYVPTANGWKDHYKCRNAKIAWYVNEPDLEPIEPVQEEESQKFFPLEFRLNNIGLLVGSVDIEYVVKYDQALQLAESTISRLKSEIEELKRKA